MKTYTITIGIPAYNEAANIQLLLKAILAQKITSAALKEIIVVSDGSTDKTVELARSINDNRIRVIDHKTRTGNNTRQSEIISLTQTDILILLNADVIPLGIDFIEQIISPIIKNKNVGLVSADTLAAKPNNFIEKVIATSHELKKDMYKRINNSHNVYLCHGRARAFSKPLYSKIIWPEDCPEDAFSYLACITQGFKFVFTPKAKVLFKSPTTIKDHINQSTRFYAGKKALQPYFSPDFIVRQYQIPKPIFIKSVIKYLLTYPLETTSFIALSAYIRLFLIDNATYQARWNISPTTKGITYS